MKIRLPILLLAIILASCTGQQPVAYKSFLMVNKATDPGHAFVLLQVTSESNGALDAGLAKFVLAPGESQTQTFHNKNFPGRDYVFSVRIEDKIESPLVETTIVVKEKGVVLHRSAQTASSGLHF